MKHVVAVMVLVVAGCAPTTSHVRTTPTTTTISTLAPISPPIDMLNPSVSPQTEAKTVCVKGWTTTIRPPVSYTAALKGRQLVSYGYADRNFAHYEEDHAVPLELGGNPSAPANLWPQPCSTSLSDDHAENDLRSKVCARTMTLADAQARIYALKVAHGYRRAASVK